MGPSCNEHQMLMCLIILVIIALVNMRGVKETGFVFLLPTILFVGTLLTTIGVGVFEALSTHGHPIPHWTPPPPVDNPTSKLADGCCCTCCSRRSRADAAAMTGVEARIERRDGVQGTAQQECQHHPDGDYRDPDHPALWIELRGAGRMA